MGLCRTLLVAPIIGLSCILSLFFLVLWLVLFPIKCCCPACSCCISIVEWSFEKGVKLPVNLAKCLLKATEPSADPPVKV